METFEKIFDDLDDNERDFLAIGILLGGVEGARNILAILSSEDDAVSASEELTKYANWIIADAREIQAKLQEKM
jgi:hypothetical protein